MPLAGQIIRALDFTQSMEAWDTTDITGISSTSYIAGSPEVGTAFIAPTSGRVVVLINGRIESDTGGGDRIFLSFELYEGSDSSGTQVLAGDDDSACVTGSTATGEGQSASKLVTGLTPGATYFARTVHRVGAGNATVRLRRIVVSPAT